MKVTDLHRAYMQNEIHKCVLARKAAGKPAYEADWIAAGLTPRRYRWDIARDANLVPWICDKLYRYANDTHIDTALRHIVRELKIGEGN